MPPQPFAGRAEKRFSGVVIVEIEEPEEPGAVAVELVVGAVADRRDASDRASVTQG